MQDRFRGFCGRQTRAFLVNKLTNALWVRAGSFREPKRERGGYANSLQCSHLDALTA